MLCEKCGEREATIQLTEVINGERTDHHYCQQCAMQMGMPGGAFLGAEIPLGRLLSGILGLGGEIDENDEETSEEDAMSGIVCPTCGTSYGSFVKNSRFGCPDCYSVFDLLMDDNMKNVQGSDTHTGKKPHNGGSKVPAPASSLEDEIHLLQLRLKDALEDEDYESAAKYRDEIREKKGRLNADG